MELPVEVLIAWARKAERDNVFGLTVPIRIISKLSHESITVHYNKVGYSKCDNITLKLEGFIEFYNDYYNLDTQPVAKPINILNTKIWVGEDKELRTRIVDRLIELGARDTNSIRNKERAAIYVYSSGSLAHTDDYNFFLKEDSYTVLNINQLIINTNNTPLNNKTDGKSIIVSKPVARVQRGQRPEGNRISGKTGRATVSGRHISHRTISI